MTVKKSVVNQLLLSELFSSRERKLEVFTLYRRLRLSPSMLHKAIERLSSKGLLNEDNGVVRLTSEGAQVLLSSGRQSLSHRDKPWRKPVKSFQDDVINPGQVYIPNLRKLDPNHFTSIKGLILERRAAAVKISTEE